MSVIIKPLITEKTAQQKEAGKLYLKVKKEANKIQIKQEIEKLFNVKVKAVNTMNVSGKKKRYGRNIGQSSDWKKAIVELKEGQTIQDYESLF